jgi:N-acetylglucosaminyldiphosphoundecaprenol N-acetyl-beta-D-mannosaminyltransferase
MSAPALIRAINDAAPDFLVVSLGALKGQAWIMRNHADLAVPWISHLGAVVNFFAGEVRRAPSWLAAAGLEWCWRIVQEPNLWRRYWSDGKTVVHLLCWRMLTNLVRARLSQPRKRIAASHVLNVVAGKYITLQLSGDWGDAQAPALARLLEEVLVAGGGVRVVLSEVTRLGNGVIAQLMVARGRAELREIPLSCRAPSATARYSLMAHCADYLLESPT